VHYRRAGSGDRRSNIAFALILCGRPRNLAAQFMSNVPSDLKYAKSHEWVRVNGGTGTVGITDHAQQELTDIVFVELPVVGRKVKAGEACAVVESVKTASDIYSPVSGEITEVNPAVVDNPALVNTEPHAGGWFYKIKLSNAAELNTLLSPEDYKKQIGG
jgi:glycine cleavage system H protein